MSSLVKSPLPELKALQKQMETALRQCREGAPVENEPQEGWQPPVDLWEDEEKLVLQMELPGIEQQQIDVQIEDGMLVVQGERCLREVEGRRYLRLERSYGYFCRRFVLPEGVERGRVRAQVEHGLLKVVFPKAGPQHPLHIAVESTE